MPTDAYIKFKATGFWIPESFIAVLSDYICQVFEHIGVNTYSEHLQNIYINCHINRGGSNIGMVDIPFEDTITSDEDKIDIINVLNLTKAFIASKGSELSIETLESFEDRKVDNYFKDPWAFSIKTKSLVTTIDIIIQMLNGTWTSTNYSVYYAGFPNPMNMQEI